MLIPVVRGPREVASSVSKAAHWLAGNLGCPDFMASRFPESSKLILSLTAKGRDNHATKPNSQWSHFGEKYDSTVYYASRMAVYHALARRGDRWASWQSDDSESSPVCASVCRNQLAGSLAVAKAFGGKTGFASAIDGAARGTPDGICQLSFMPGLPSGAIHIVASLLSSHDDTDCFTRSSAGQF